MVRFRSVNRRDFTVPRASASSACNPISVTFRCVGGTVDPKTGEIVWEMHVPVADQLAHYRSHPPGAIRALGVTPLETIDWRFDGHGEPVNSIFELACPCGSRLFTPMCGVDETNEVCPPISLECDACEAAFEVFDANAHGWNAVMCGDRYDEPERYCELEGEVVVAPHEIVVRFEHGSSDLGDPELAGREQEVFSWFTLLARDPETKQLEQLFEWECA